MRFSTWVGIMSPFTSANKQKLEISIMFQLICSFLCQTENLRPIKSRSITAQDPLRLSRFQSCKYILEISRFQSCKCEGQTTISAIRITPLIYLLTIGCQWVHISTFYRLSKITVSCKYGCLIAHQELVHDFSFIYFSYR
jgi:hypothetical protein